MLRSSTIPISLLVLVQIVICTIIVPSMAAVNTTTKPSGSGKPKKTTPVALPVAQPAVKPINAVVMNENEDASLQCLGAQVIAWYQGSTQKLLSNDLVDEKGKTGKYIITDSTLNITKVGRADVGPYICYDGTTRANYTAQLFMKPTFTKRLPASLNIGEGEYVKLMCDTYGWPQPIIAWFRSNGTFTQPLTVNVTAEDPRIVANGSILAITPAVRKDYMLYGCISMNSIGSSNSTILIRVRGRFTAVWPFIGIVIEVVILVVVIVIFEKKKAKKIAEKQATQEEEEKLMLAQQTKGKSDVRQRK